MTDRATAAPDAASPASTPGVADRLDAAIRRYGLHAALVVALTALIGSLYFSNIRGYTPCVLCWYQRIFMYPLAFILAIGIGVRDRAVARYVIPPALVGTAVAVYHVLLQKTDWLPETPACKVSVPCSSDYIYWLGFITIPVLSLTAFVLILIFVSSTLTPAAEFEPAWGARPWGRVAAIVFGTVVVFIVLWRIDPRAVVQLGPVIGIPIVG